MMAARKPAAEEAAITEIDCVPGFPHPRETTSLFGHGNAERILHDAWQGGRLHHAWLLTGPVGIGKATLAYRFARFLLDRHDAGDAATDDSLHIDPERPAFRQIVNFAHPDLLVLRRPWMAQRKRHATAITIDEARRLRTFLGQTSAQGGWRVVIVDSADDLNMAAANGLLKSLEEPPEACVFLLVSASPGRLPVTIRSRCRRLRLAPLSNADMTNVVTGLLPDDASGAGGPSDLQQIFTLAQGSPGLVLRMLAEDGLALYGEMIRVLASLPRLDHDDAHRLAESLSGRGAEGRHELFHSMLSSLLARLVAHAATGTGASGQEAALAERLIGSGMLAQWAGLWETLQRARAEADALNLDRKLHVLETFFRLEQVARGEADAG